MELNLERSEDDLRMAITRKQAAKQAARGRGETDDAEAGAAKARMRKRAQTVLKAKRQRVPVWARLAMAGAATVAIAALADLEGLIFGEAEARLGVADATLAMVEAAPEAAPATAGPAPAALASLSPDPAAGEAQQRTVGAVIESTEAVWGDILGRMGIAYQPPLRVGAARVTMSACAAEAGLAVVTEGAAYCASERVVYADPGILASARETLAVAHAVGRHIGGLFGGEEGASGLQADCFAGVWARAAGGLTLEAAAAELASDGARVAAFAQGFSAGSALTCQEMFAEL